MWKHLAVMDIDRTESISVDESIIDNDADAVRITVVTDAICYVQQASKSFCDMRSGFLSQPSGSLTVLISLYSSRVLRCLVTSTRVASMI